MIRAMQGCPPGRGQARLIIDFASLTGAAGWRGAPISPLLP